MGSNSSTSRGVHGFVPGSGDAVYAEGRFAATGNKAFLQPHPVDPAQAIMFVCLEGNESGTNFRGTARLVSGRAEVPVPEEWKLASEPDGITVQLTTVRSLARIAVMEKSLDRIVVAGTEDCEFDYLVNGVRRGFADYEPFLENHAFRPQVKRVPFGTQYPDALRNILVRNGILNPDYTPNEDTAARLGWELEEPEDVPLEERWWLDPEERQRLIRSQFGASAPASSQTGGE